MEEQGTLEITNKKLREIAERDLKHTEQKNRDYNESWKQRGGVGAFMMLARKWDRIEPFVRDHGYDIFAAMRADTRMEPLLEDIGDLRRYLGLVEAEHEIQAERRHDMTQRIRENNRAVHEEAPGSEISGQLSRRELEQMSRERLDLEGQRRQDVLRELESQNQILTGLLSRCHPVVHAALSAFPAERHQIAPEREEQRSELKDLLSKIESATNRGK